MELKKYNKDSLYSYTYGAYPTFELLKNKPECVAKIICHEKLQSSPDIDKLLKIAKSKNIEIIHSGKTIEKLSGKDNIYIMGVFKKYALNTNRNTNQVVLVNPSDMGNLGTIIRVMLGFGYSDLILITPCVDYFDPKVIRASMGSIFSMNIQEYPSLEEYLETTTNTVYPFMLQAKTTLQTISKKQTPHTLVFGTESSGLDDKYLKVGTPLKIAQTNKIDSFNLSMAVGIALYEFSK